MENKEAKSNVRVRFAPSPTGYLHTGGARTALFNWLFARKHNGTFILRIEDTDEKRSTHENTQAILDSLRWLGLDWDEGPEVGGDFAPYFQSERKGLHLKYADRLWRDGHAYYCDCEPLGEEREERSEVENEYSAENDYTGGTRGQYGIKTPATQVKAESYQGVFKRCKCIERTMSEQLKLLAVGKAVALKLKVEPGEEISFTDIIRGEMVFKTEDIGDQVLVKRTGSPTYNFACVVDDATMEITHVIRGEDHLSNTPKQILIYKKLGLTPPAFAHLPLILGMDRARLSKRHGATSVSAYREIGILPEAMVNFLLLIGWNPKDEREEFTRDEMIANFDLTGIQKAAGVFNLEKLFWFNGRYIRTLSDEEYLKRIYEYVPAEWKKAQREDYIAEVLLLFKDRVTHLSEIEELAWWFFRAPNENDFKKEAWLEIMNGEQVETVLKVIPARLKAIKNWEKTEIENVIRKYANEKELKLKDVVQPLRVAITGDKFSPGFFELAEIIGSAEIAKRAEFARELLKKKDFVV